MKCFEKKMAEFSIIYLHNPSKCRKCTAIESCGDRYSKIYGSFSPRKKLVRKVSKKDHYFQASTPHQMITIAARNKLADSNDMEQKFQFKKPFEIFTPEKSPTRSRMLKKKNLSNIPSKTVHDFQDSFSGKTVKKISSPGKKTTLKQSESSGNKQDANLDNKDDSKAPRKGTLKRKRWYYNQLNTSNDNYEDDMFEDQKFGHFQNLLEDETDNVEQYEELQTPVFPFSISPRAETPSPTYKDCYSPTELSISRKGAEEYHYRRGRRRRLLFTNFKIEAPKAKPPPRKVPDTQKTLEEVVKILSERQNFQDRSSDSEDDQYFSDILDKSPKILSC